MKLVFHRQPARFVPRVSFPRSARWLGLSFIGVFVCAVGVSSDTSDDEVMLRLPEGRHAALANLGQLRSFERPWAYTKQPGAARESLLLDPEIPQFPTNTQWGLVRRMCVIDTEGRVQPTPVTESIQVRRYLE